MAKIKKENENEISIIKKQKPNQFAGVKALTNWLLKTSRKFEDFENLYEKFNFDKMIVKRILSYSYDSPQTIWYINKYLNNLYLWDSWDFKNIIKSIVYIYDLNGVTNSRKMFFIKSSENKDDNRKAIIALFDNYFKTCFNKNYNNRILRYYYYLYLIGDITSAEIIEIDKLLNNGKQTLKLKINDDTKQDLEFWEKKIELPEISVSEKIEVMNSVNDEIKSFIDEIKSEKLKREKCKSCELFSSQMVVLDTNIKAIPSKDKPLDVFLFGLNPGLEEAKMDQPFTPAGKSGKYIRDQIANFPENTSWMISNIILCSTRNKVEIKEYDDVVENCSGFIDKIRQKFPAKLYVCVGSDSAKVFGIDGSITKISGNYYEDKKTIPVVHPSGMRSAPAQQAAKVGWDAIHGKIKENFNTKQDLPKINQKQTTKKQTKPKKNNNLENRLLFDIRELSDKKVLMIYVDENGNKEYETVDYKLKSYIKDSNFKECSITTDSVDYEFSYKKDQKWKLLRELRNNLENLKKV